MLNCMQSTKYATLANFRRENMIECDDIAEYANTSPLNNTGEQSRALAYLSQQTASGNWGQSARVISKM